MSILVDYTYDTNSFFDTQAKRDSMQAVADRFARIIDSSLLQITAGYGSDWRVGFSHPGTGADFQISTAMNAGSDSLIGAGASAASVYDPAFTLPANVWRLYAGGRTLASAGIGGTGTGFNFTNVFNDPNGPMHRGAFPVTPGSSSSDLPAWGGAISFNTGLNWHFDLAATAPAGASDFYSIALHEVGHALGLSASWNNWKDANAGNYTGAQAVAACNADSGASLASLDEVSPANLHWREGAYDSFVFSLASPVTAGVVPAGVRQDLLMEPIASFNAMQRRFELTNVDVAALRDIGWQVIPEPSAALLLLAGGAALAMRTGRTGPRRAPIAR